MSCLGSIGYEGTHGAGPGIGVHRRFGAALFGRRRQVGPGLGAVWRPQGRWQYERVRFTGRCSEAAAVASMRSPRRDNLIALGGHGAMGGLGEILLVDAVTGNLQAALYDEQLGHRQVIVSLAVFARPSTPGARLHRSRGEGVVLATGSPDRTVEAARNPADRHRPLRCGDRRAVARCARCCTAGDGRWSARGVAGLRGRSAPPNGIAWQLEKIDVTTG